jgi:hypothetical protein
MNNPIRCLIVVAAAAMCSAGWMSTAHDKVSSAIEAAESDRELLCDYWFASGDLRKFSYAQLEEIVRDDASTRFPNARIELSGLTKAERGAVTMTVVLFGPNEQSQAFLYALVPNKESWKISSARKLWFVPPSQIARGLRI